MVIDPSDLNYVMPEDATHKEYMGVCLKLLDLADGIYMLRGWEESQGACMELGYALASDKIIMFEKESERREQYAVKGDMKNYCGAEIFVRNHMDNGWIPVDERLPDEYEGLVLIQVSGKPTENITLDNAMELAAYITDEGWILEGYPEWETPEVIAWQPLPEPYKTNK